MSRLDNDTDMGTPMAELIDRQKPRFGVGEQAVGVTLVTAAAVALFAWRIGIGEVIGMCKPTADDSVETAIE